MSDQSFTDVSFSIVSASNFKVSCSKPLLVANSPVFLSWKNLCLSTNASVWKGEHIILNGLSGCLPGGLCGVMGSTGSGKTTFLSALALRVNSSHTKVSGDVLLNGRPYSKRILKKMSGYVMQDDLVDACFTVFQVLEYTAELRMKRSATQLERSARVEEVIEIMGITGCRNVVVGDTRNKGISGGERKRLCIAMELLNRPKLLFLDEPTSGIVGVVFV